MRVLCACLIGTACARAEPQAKQPVWEFAPGDYSIAMEALEGSKKGSRASGELSLRSLKRAWSPMFGWTSVDVKVVGAPVCGTKPDSRDPENPGVVIFQLPADAMPSRRLESQVLLIGTNANAKATRGATDGCGIGLHIEARVGECFRGHWREWGLFADGRGKFELCPALSGRRTSG